MKVLLHHKAMAVLNLAGLTPISHHKPSSSPEKKPGFRNLLPLKLPAPLATSLASLPSALCANGLARALTYEEALSQSIGSPPGFASFPDFDIAQFVNEAVKFGADNPLAVGGGAAVLAVPLALSQVLKRFKNRGVVSAKSAYARLGEDGGAQLLDIREGKEVKEVGTPDVRGLKKKAVAVAVAEAAAYRGDDKEGFLKKLKLRFKEPENMTLFVLDKFDGNSKLITELVTTNGFKAAYAIKDGAEGPRGWIKSGLPWMQPKKGVAIDFGDISDAITGVFEDSSDSLPVTVGLAAAAGLGLFAFTEIETVLQLLGSAAIIQLVATKLLFAEDRKKTIKQVEEFLNSKVAPKELIDEIKTIGKGSSPATPATEKSEASTSADLPVSETKSELKEEAPTEPPPAVDAVPK